jgi:enoyl-CoA hydratase
VRSVFATGVDNAAAAVTYELSTVAGNPLAVVSLNRPGRRNALDVEMLQMVDGCMGRAVADAARVVIVTGAPPAFCAGADVNSFVGLTPSEAAKLMALGQDVFERIETCALPVIAAVSGYALGGGLELAMACGLRIAGRSAKFGQPEITLANIPGWGGTQRLPRLIGESAAMDLILTGRIIGSTEAQRLGLVHRVVDDDQALAAAFGLAEQLASRSATALSCAKDAIYAGRAEGGAGYRVERDGVARCFSTEEQQLAVQRFLQRSSTAPEREGPTSGEPARTPDEHPAE